MEFILKESARSMLTVFAIIALGYLLGSIKIRGIGLGTAAVFLSGVLFGHFGAQVPEVLQTLGLLLFITSIGLSAGPSFVRRMKMNGTAYVILCLTIAFTGALVCAGIIRLGHVDAPLAVGLMTGAFTTSPGFAAAKEAVSANEELVNFVAAGYGLSYPAGVIIKVLAIQLIPRFLHADMEKERALIALPDHSRVGEERPRKKLETWGLLAFAITIVLGILAGGVTIRLPGGGSFALGTTGGPLLVGLLIGHLRYIGNIDLQPNPQLYGPAKEIGLILFFTGSGVEGGRGLVEILSEYGVALLIYGVILVVIPLIAGFLLFRRVLKLPLLNGLGSITASMTSTPSLAVLVETAGTDDVVAAYATTYPIALITLVILVQFLVTL